MFVRGTLCMLGLSGALAVSVAGEPALDIRPHEASAVCGARSPQIKVIVENVSAKGILTVELYRPSKRDFLKKASRVHRIRVPARKGPQTVCFDIDKAGTYAVAAYQDLDADRNLDQKLNLMPAEPFGLSSKKKLTFGMPVFDDAAFQVPAGGTVIRIKLQR